MPRPRLLDLFCGAGGAAMGYHRAGFDVAGVDTDRAALRQYPFPAIRADALDVLIGDILDLDGFDAIHASPPCQLFSITKHSQPSTRHYDLLTPTRALLQRTGKPYVIENVPGAPMPGALVLCGTEFGLHTTDTDGRTITLRRHRLFESNVHLMGAGGCYCGDDRARGRIAGVYGGGSIARAAASVLRGGYTPTPTVAGQLLGVDWMGRNQLTQAIPPAYTEHIGAQLITALATEGATP